MRAEKLFNFSISEAEIKDYDKSWPNVTVNTFSSDLKLFLGQKLQLQFK